MALSPAEVEWRIIEGVDLNFSKDEFLKLLEIPEAVNMLARYGDSDKLYNCENHMQVPLASVFLIVRGPKNVLRCLLHEGLDLNKKDVEGRQPLFYLLKLQGVKECYEDVFFEHWKPNLNIMDRWGRNCLTYFIEKNIDPMNDPKVLAKISHMRSPLVMKIQRIEGTKNINLMKRPVLELKRDDGSVLYGLLLVYNNSSVIVPIKDGSEEGIEIVWEEQRAPRNGGLLYSRVSNTCRWKISLDIGNLLTGYIEYGAENKVVLTTSDGECLQGQMLVSEVEKAVLNTCVLSQLNRLFIPNTDMHINQFKKCQITQGQHRGEFAQMISLTETPKRLLLLTEGPEGCNFFRPTFVSLNQEQFQFVHLNGESLDYRQHTDIVKRSFKFLSDLLRLTRLDI